MDEVEGINAIEPCDDFAMILYKSIMEDESYSLPEKLIMCYVRGFDAARKPCFANSKTIAARFGMADCHIRKIRAGLVAKGKLHRMERTWKGRTLPIFSTYPIPGEAPCNKDTIKKPCTTDTPSPDDRVPDTQGVCLSDTVGVSNIHRGCVPDTRGVCTTDTHNKNNNINLNKKVTEKSDRAREESATSATVLKKIKEGEEEQPKPPGRAEQLQAEYLKGVRTPTQIETEIIAEGRDPNAKMDPALAKQKFAALLETIAKRKAA